MNKGILGIFNKCICFAVLTMDFTIAIEEILNAQAFKSAIEEKSVNDANAICMRLMVEAL